METTQTPEVERMSFTEKLTNIFAAPGELYENVRDTGPTPSNWVIPWIIFLVIAIIMGQLLINDPSLSDQLGQMIWKGFEQNIQDGKMTEAQAEEVFNSFAKPGTTMFTAMQIGGVTIISLVGLFAIALVYWLLGKTAMKATSPYKKVVEVVGLTFFISALEQIVTTVFMFIADSITATPSLGAFVSDFDMMNKTHMFLAKANIFTFWTLIVTSIGLSKLFRRDFPKVLVLVVALWILWTLLTVFAGIRLS